MALGWGIFLLVAVVAFIKRKWIKEKLIVIYKGIKGDKGDAGQDGSDGSTTVIVNSGGGYQQETGFPLKIYDKGELVRQLQTGLNSKYKAGLKVDGYFGPKTQAAVSKHMGNAVVSKSDFDKLKVKLWV